MLHHPAIEKLNEHGPITRQSAQTGASQYHRIELQVAEMAQSTAAGDDQNQHRQHHADDAEVAAGQIVGQQSADLSAKIELDEEPADELQSGERSQSATVITQHQICIDPAP